MAVGSVTEAAFRPPSSACQATAPPPIVASTPIASARRDRAVAPRRIAQHDRRKEQYVEREQAHRLHFYHRNESLRMYNCLRFFLQTIIINKNLKWFDFLK